MITPIMLRSFGRSGSTLLMQVLGTSSNVIFDREYPFEKRHLTYLHRVAKVASAEAENGDDWNPDTLFDRNLKRVGPIPYVDTSIVDRSKLRTDYLLRLWNGFSSQVISKAAGSVDPSRPLYYAEKVVHDICEDVNQTLEAKNIFLLRDPRDEFLSIKSFNHKRGFKGFGWQENDSDESYALRLCDMRKTFMRHVSNLKSDHRKIFIKYESFMRDPFRFTDEIGDWLDLSLNYGEVLQARDTVSQHITSEANSIRWKSELSPRLKKIFSDNIGEELNSLGYEV
ncbi:sulfotransferase [Microbulbifer sp. HZ11]|uniref:sulfotransferase n=1 Tax=Microbulbifer sp. HZ11 TaxID=1453501 RepID=UPI0012DC2198|nr:sulfotransferase [Microbulbifer sp. HZ11]